jgi:integrase
MPNPTPRILTHNGESLPLREWARRKGIHAETLRCRIDVLGYSVADAIETPAAAKFAKRGGSAPVVRPCPRMTRHKASGQACVRWRGGGGRDRIHYLGAWRSKEAAAEYQRFLLEWAASGGREEQTGGDLTVAGLIKQYLVHVDAYYVKDGKPTAQRAAHRAALKVLNKLYGDTPAAEFKQSSLRACQRWLIDADLTRITINGYVAIIRRCFAWGVGQELLDESVHRRLEYVEPLQPGRTGAKDAEAVLSVPDDAIEKTIPKLHPLADRRAVLEAMIRFQLVTGLRPGELCRMAVQDIDRGEEEWCYRIRSHKNLHRGARRKSARVWLGPKACAILAPFLARPDADGRVWVFPPKGKGRKTTAISRGSYATFVRRACDKAGVERWHPHQLRHNRATFVHDAYESDEAVAAAIGDTPEVARHVYVDPRDAVARRIARATG